MGSMCEMLSNLKFLCWCYSVTQSSRPVTSLQLGNLADVTKKEAAGMLPGSTSFYALRVALDSFR